MKKIMTTILYAICFAVMTGCATEPGPKKLKMTAANISAAPGETTLVYQLINPTDSAVGYGAYYTIDRLDGEDWIPMPVNDETAFIDIMYELPAHDTSVLYPVEIYPGRFAYPAGEYRIRKEVYAGSRKTTLTAPFSLDGERNTRPDIKFEVVPGVYDSVPEKIQYIITNSSEDKIEFGTVYEIDRLVDMQWQLVPYVDNMGFDMVAYYTMPGESMSNDIFLYRDKVDYPAGIYRLRKQVKTGTGERTVYAMFRIR
ncbi:MAG: hypothetical protein LBQ60_11740 [Bacteroidales bacterium]|nr:hypothetical protein [Bacteroidales bacterium]